MTKEEYDILLSSNYWIGYSHKLIKERNYTCEDCGAHYPGKRDMFEVHHLVYRDIKPWLYEPEEVLVLCKACYAKRHGIVLNTGDTKRVEPKKQEGSYCKSYQQQKEDDASKDISVLDFRHPVWKSPNMKKFLVLLAIVLLFCGYKIFRHSSPQQPDKQEIAAPQTEEMTPIKEEVNTPVQEEKSKEDSILEKEKNRRKFWEDRARQEGVSTDGSIQDIKDRIHRKFMEERKRKLLE